ncbi:MULTISPECIES: hypothetical protein [unclassified Flavobacterium]|uniref:hypothetical protein n=1 Tax=unclassified Flavobacterium TaxID=196869 RepID=UPI000EB3D40D|nr:MULTISPECIES: hypothetical protein [unclassified Flavobacterium]RKS14339.1 hypothetical protein C8C87_1613 [Flavobacterium sp. 120]WKL44180.1 hypothetical protein Q1W72_00815 [Flavobacterium sp. ZE23DGlu08]
MKILFLGSTDTGFANAIRSSKPILLLFFIFIIGCKNKPANKTIQIEFAKPVNGFRAKIYWTPQYIITNLDEKERKWVVGKAILELERIADKVKYRIDYNLSIGTLVDSDFKKSVYESFMNHDLPGVITVQNKTEKGIINKEDALFYERNEAFFFFKDVNFDGKDDLLIVEESLEANDKNKVHRVYEFQDNELVEFQYFPSLVFTYSRNYIGKIDYSKKEISVSSYYSCCEYDIDFYRLDGNTTNKFILYKKEKINLNKPIITKYYKE